MKNRFTLGLLACGLVGAADVPGFGCGSNCSGCGDETIVVPPTAYCAPSDPACPASGQGATGPGGSGQGGFGQGGSGAVGGQGGAGGQGGVSAHVRSKRFGDVGSDSGRDVATDGSGNVIVTGQFGGSVDFGGGPLTSAGGSDIFLAKYDGSGSHLWSHRFGDTFSDAGNSVAADSAGGVLLTGTFDGAVDFGGGPLSSAGGGDIFVAKYDTNGNHVWSQRFGDSLSETSYGVAVDGAGNVVITGLFDGSVDFGGGVLTGVGGVADIFVAKFDGSGNHVWSKRFGDSSPMQQGLAVAVDGSGNVVVTGGFAGTVDFGGGPLMSSGSDIFLAKLDSDGNHTWSKNFANGDGLSVATDSSGNVVLAGAFGGTVDFGGGPLTSAGSFDIFVAKFGANGSHGWSRQFGSVENDAANAVTTDASGNVVITGRFANSVAFGGGPLTSAGSEDIFVARFDGSGMHLWSEAFGAASADAGFAVAADGTGDVVIVGVTGAGAVDFGGGPLNGTSDDIFVAKFAP